MIVADENAEGNGQYTYDDPSGFWKRACNVKGQTVDWLWQGRLARGLLNGIVGDGQVGKTSLLCKLIADLSRGVALPGQGPLAPQTCWYVTVEDPIEYAQRPKLELYGADLGRVLLSEALPPHGAMRAAIKQEGVSLLVLDSMTSMQDGDGKNVMSDYTAPTQWLKPYKELAAETGCAVLFVRHKPKAAAGKPSLYGALGSVGATTYIRVELDLSLDADGTRRLTRTKGNYGSPPPAVAWEFSPGPGDHPLIECKGLVMGDGPAPSTKPKKLPSCVMWLHGRLASGPVPSATLLNEGLELGFSKDTQKTARSDLKAATYQKGGQHWVHLPEAGTA